MTPQPPEVDSTHAVSYFVATLVAMAFVVLEPQGCPKTPPVGRVGWNFLQIRVVFFWETTTGRWYFWKGRLLILIAYIVYCFFGKDGEIMIGLAKIILENLPPFDIWDQDSTAGMDTYRYIEGHPSHTLLQSVVLSQLQLAKLLHSIWKAQTLLSFQQFLYVDSLLSIILQHVFSCHE